MAKLVKSEKISLKNHPEINENSIQEFIFKDPTILGLGELIPIQREKIQPAGGRLDILLSDKDNLTRYEVEIQLGATDPSHIIRTIEYWDTERKRYPKYDHCAVIIAEEITGRFMNVISLFNGAIPLIALQMSAVKHGDDIAPIFTKVLDRVSYGNEEDDDVSEITDRNYWENRSTSVTMKVVDKIFADMEDYLEGYQLKYNKFYIGLAKNGVSKNFMFFKPKKAFLYLFIRCQENAEITNRLEQTDLEVNYNTRENAYELRFDKYPTFEKNKDLIIELLKAAK